MVTLPPAATLTKIRVQRNSHLLNIQKQVEWSVEQRRIHIPNALQLPHQMSGEGRWSFLNRARN